MKAQTVGCCENDFYSVGTSMRWIVKCNKRWVDVRERTRDIGIPELRPCLLRKGGPERGDNGTTSQHSTVRINGGHQKEGRLLKESDISVSKGPHSGLSPLDPQFTDT